MALCLFIANSAYYANKLIKYLNYCNLKNFCSQILIFKFLKKR